MNLIKTSIFFILLPSNITVVSGPRNSELVHCSLLKDDLVLLIYKSKTHYQKNMSLGPVVITWLPYEKLSLGEVKFPVSAQQRQKETDRHTETERQGQGERERERDFCRELLHISRGLKISNVKSSRCFSANCTISEVCFPQGLTEQP